MEFPIIISFAQSVLSRFHLAMRDVVQKKQWLIEEDLLGFRLDNTMFFCAFSGITDIPVKACNQRKFNHMCILPTYTSVASHDNKLLLSDQGKLSRRSLAQPPRQATLAPEQGRYELGVAFD